LSSFAKQKYLMIIAAAELVVLTIISFSRYPHRESWQAMIPPFIAVWTSIIACAAGSRYADTLARNQFLLLNSLQTGLHPAKGKKRWK
jgi:hypothetical protein